MGEERDEAFINEKVAMIWNSEIFQQQAVLFKEVLSPSEKYKLEINSFKHPDPQYWGYTQGKIYGKEKGNLIAEVRRNYGGFNYTWIENHKNGNDYLLCGSDYQGQTMVCLNTGEVKHYIPLAAKQGWGFCWTAVYPNKDASLLAVVGCIWAAPYETKIYDLSDPMSLPFPLLFTTECDNFEGWTDDEIPTCHMNGELEVCNKEGRLKGLTWNEILVLGAEDEETEDSGNSDWWKTENRRIKWKMGDVIVN